MTDTITTPLARMALTRTRDADGYYRCDAIDTITALLFERRDYVQNRIVWGCEKQQIPQPEDRDFSGERDELRATWQGVIRLLCRCFQGRKRIEIIEILLDEFTEREAGQG